MASKIESLGGDEWFMGRIAEGCTMSSVADELQCNRWALYTWCKKTPEREALWKEARKYAAHSHADDAQAIAENTSEDSIRSDRLRVSTKQWLAERMNREEYGQTPLIQTTVTINQLHLDALRAPMVAAQEALRAERLARIDAAIEQIALPAGAS